MSAGAGLELNLDQAYLSQADREAKSFLHVWNHELSRRFFISPIRMKVWNDL